MQLSDCTVLVASRSGFVHWGGIDAVWPIDRSERHPPATAFADDDDDGEARDFDPKMVTRAMQLVDRQTAAYEPADIEDRYKTRLGAPTLVSMLRFDRG